VIALARSGSASSTARSVGLAQTRTLEKRLIRAFFVGFGRMMGFVMLGHRPHSHLRIKPPRLVGNLVGRTASITGHDLFPRPARSRGATAPVS